MFDPAGFEGETLTERLAAAALAGAARVLDGKSALPDGSVGVVCPHGAWFVRCFVAGHARLLFNAARAYGVACRRAVEVLIGFPPSAALWAYMVLAKSALLQIADSYALAVAVASIGESQHCSAVEAVVNARFALGAEALAVEDAGAAAHRLLDFVRFAYPDCMTLGELVTAFAVAGGVARVRKAAAAVRAAMCPARRMRAGAAPTSWASRAASRRPRLLLRRLLRHISWPQARVRTGPCATWQRTSWCGPATAA